MKDRDAHITMEQMEQIIKLFHPCMDDYLYAYDLVTDYYCISPHALKRFNLPDDHFFHAEEMHHQFVYGEDMPLLSAEFAKIRAGLVSFHNIHYRWLDREDKLVWINCRGKILTDENGEPYLMVGCINEIGEKQKADNVSGLLGESSLSSYIGQFKGTLPAGYFLRIGIDDFKEINGDIGIEYGDYVLRRTAECIQSQIDSKQRLYRLVADEFMVVDLSGGSFEDAALLYKKIRKSIDAFIEEIGYKSVFTISAGVTDARVLEATHENVMKMTEFALNEAKIRGKNRCYLFKKDDYKAFLRKNEIIRQLHHAVNHEFQGFKEVYQPIVDARTYQLIGAEALMRFSIPVNDSNGNAEGREQISPAEFIPLLEETGLIIPAGRWMLHQAFTTCVNWQKYMPGFQMNINLSYIQVIKSKVLTEIMTAIRDTGVSTACVGVELTESGYLDSNSHFQKLWSGLKAIGVKLIIDDFGTGYSNLHCIGELGPTYLKIDRTFTAKALEQEYEWNLMSQIVEMTHSLKLAICIEGIETPEELARMRKLRPDYIQGYLFGKPVNQIQFENKFMELDGKDGGTHAVSDQTVS